MSQSWEARSLVLRPLSASDAGRETNPVAEAALRAPQINCPLLPRVPPAHLGGCRGRGKEAPNAPGAEPVLSQRVIWATEQLLGESRRAGRRGRKEEAGRASAPCSRGCCWGRFWGRGTSQHWVLRANPQSPGSQLGEPEGATITQTVNKMWLIFLSWAYKTLTSPSPL